MKKYIVSFLIALIAVWSFSFIRFIYEFRIFVRTNAPENTEITFEYKTKYGNFLKTAKTDKNHQAFFKLNTRKIKEFRVSTSKEITISSVYFHGDKGYDIRTQNGIWQKQPIRGKIIIDSLFSCSFFGVLVFLFVSSLFCPETNVKRLQAFPKFMNIEFLRIVFTLSVVYCHFVPRLGIWQGAWLSVEFFFILSGFLLVINFKPELSVLTFLKRKIIRFLPLIAATSLLRFHSNIPIKDFLSDIFFLPVPSLNLNVGYIDYAWYVTLLLWGSTFYFYALKTQRKENINIILGIVCFFSYTGLMQYGWNRAARLGDKGDIGFIFSAYVLRAIADMGIGYFLAQLYQNVKLQDSKPKIGYSIFEAFILLYSILCLFFEKIYLSPIYCIISFAVLLWIFLLKKGYVSRFFEKQIWTKMSKYCLSIYLVQGLIVSVLFPRFLNEYSAWMMGHKAIVIVSTLLASVIFGIIGYYLVEKPATEYLKKRLFNKQPRGGGQ